MWGILGRVSTKGMEIMLIGHFVQFFLFFFSPIFKLYILKFLGRLTSNVMWGILGRVSTEVMEIMLMQQFCQESVKAYELKLKCNKCFLKLYCHVTLNEGIKRACSNWCNSFGVRFGVQSSYFNLPEAKILTFFGQKSIFFTHKILRHQNVLHWFTWNKTKSFSMKPLIFKSMVSISVHFQNDQWFFRNVIFSSFLLWFGPISNIYWLIDRFF